MVTAIIKQRIRKRERLFTKDAIAEAGKWQKSERQIIPSGHYPENKVKTGRNNLRHLVLNKYVLFCLLLGLCCLLFVITAANPLHLYARMQTGNVPVLPDDPFFENAVFTYAISDDVNFNDETPESSASAESLNNLKIRYYHVAAGENLAAIAKRYDLNLDTIISYNNIQNARSIKSGTKLAIPGIDGLKYKVRRGDNLSKIAQRFKIALNTLLDWNNIASETIHPGAEYFIPGARLSRNELNRILGILFVYPVAGRLSSPFGWRKDPITGARSFHNGIDLVNSENTIIKAAMDGTVAKVSYSNVFGRYVILRHSDGYQTLYGHLNKQLVRVNQKINQGETLGYMGNTGYSTGTHLHFAIFKNGEPVNPFEFLK